jgi:hypothetical protein
MKSQSEFPPGWGGKRVRRILQVYGEQTEEEAIAEDEAMWDADGQTVTTIPNKLVPLVRALIAKHQKI